MSGWNADEDGILLAMESATVGERKALWADQQRRRQLQGVLSDEEFAVVSAEAVGAGVTRTRVSLALDGMFDDEDEVFRQLTEAPPAERMVLAADPAFIALLERNLGGGISNGPNG